MDRWVVERYLTIERGHIEAGNFGRNHRERVDDVFLDDEHFPVFDAALCEDGGFLGDNVHKLRH